MLMLKLRQARLSLRDGRLDEVMSLVSDARIRSHRKGQDLATDLIDALVKRGREHLKADRVIQAAQDAEKAAKIGGERPDIAQLRADAAAKLHNQQHAAKEVSMVLGAARDHVARGLLEHGERMLKQVNGETRAVMLMHEIDAKRSQLDAALQAAGQSIKLRDISAAVRQAVLAQSLDSIDPRVLDLVADLRDELAPSVEDAFVQGKLDQASTLLDQLRKIAADHPVTLAVSRGMQLAMTAWTALSRADYSSAGDSLREIQGILPKCKWIDPALKNIERAREAINELRASAMGSLAIVQQRQQTITASQAASPMQNSRVTPQTTHLPQKFMLQVDGFGCYAVFRQPSVTVGPLSSSRLPDLGLITEPSAPAATISRMDEDYFVRGAGVVVNDQNINSKLMVNGDKISLGMRTRLTFLIPSAASTTAVLEFTSARMPRADVRRAILLDKEIVIAADKTAHVRVEHASQPVVLHVRHDQLFVETRESLLVNGTPAERNSPISLGAHVRVGNVSFIVTNA